MPRPLVPFYMSKLTGSPIKVSIETIVGVEYMTKKPSQQITE